MKKDTIYNSYECNINVDLICFDKTKVEFNTLGFLNFFTYFSYFTFIDLSI